MFFTKICTVLQTKPTGNMIQMMTLDWMCYALKKSKIKKGFRWKLYLDLFSYRKVQSRKFVIWCIWDEFGVWLRQRFRMEAIKWPSVWVLDWQWLFKTSQMLQGTGKVRSLSTGFTISRLFSIYFIIIGGKTVISCTEVSYIGVHCDKVPLYIDQGVDFPDPINIMKTKALHWIS